MLNGILIAAGFWAFVKLNWCEAMLGIGIGLFNIIVLMQELKRGPVVVVSAVLSLVAIVLGVFSAKASLSDLGDVITKGDAGLWAMLDVGYSVSYGFAYIAAGILTLITYVDYSDDDDDLSSSGTSDPHL